VLVDFDGFMLINVLKSLADIFEETVVV